MRHSPAQITVQALTDDGIMDSPSSGGDWPLYVDHLPKTKQCAAIRTTAGISDGRIMKTGEVIDHPGIQVRVKGHTYEDANQKCWAIADYFSKLKYKLVVLSDGFGYTIQAVSRFSPILPLGVEEGTGLYIFSCNFTVTLSQPAEVNQ